MPKKKKVELEFDPTLPTSSIKIGKVTYRMNFDFGALATAEAKLQAAGVECNILASIRLDSISSVRTMFAAGLRWYHPDLAWDDACALVNWQTFPLIRPVVAYALEEALADKPADPEAAEDPPKP